MNEQLDLLVDVTAADAGHEVDQLTAYTADAGAHARAFGEARAIKANPKAFADAIAAIREAAEESVAFTADDLVGVDRGPVIGAAFATLARSGELEAIGFEPSHRAISHGHVRRVWARVNR